jgi:hypothetical protein
MAREGKDIPFAIFYFTLVAVLFIWVLVALAYKGESLLASWRPLLTVLLFASPFALEASFLLAVWADD